METGNKNKTGRTITMKNLSIIIPHFSKQETLYRTWDELQLQLHPDDMITVVDDHSPDGVPDFNCRCTEVIRPPKVTPHIYRLNTLRNYGIKHAVHDAVIILDPDCVPNPRFLDHARKRTDPSILFTGCIDRVEKDGSITPDTRRRTDESYWCDLRDKGGTTVFGGVMMFSKKRTKLVDWFNETYNGAWGMAEHDFASKCYHSGMRLRFSVPLAVTHQWHESNPINYERNRELWLANRDLYRLTLGMFTQYNPAVAVLVTNPANLDKTMRSIFRNSVPLKTRLVNNCAGEQRLDMASWGNRWAVDYVNHEEPQPLSDIYDAAVKDYRNKRYKYLIIVDEGTVPKSGAITKLIVRMESDKQLHSYTEEGLTIKRLK